MKNLISTIFITIVVILVSAPAFAGGWMIYHDNPYTGKIVDVETGEPIEGAAVVGIWSLLIYGGVEVRLQFFDAKEAITDKEGKFEVPSVTGFHWWPLAGLERPEFIIFKPGYDSYPPYDLMKPGITGMEQKGFLNKENNFIKLQKVKTIDERKDVLRHVRNESFGHVDDKNNNLIGDDVIDIYKIIKNEEFYLGF